MKRYIGASYEDETNYDDDDMFDPYFNHKYLISGDDYTHEGINKYVDDPKKAIEWWFKISKKYKYTTSIMTKTKADAIELVSAGTPEYLTSLFEKYGNPYKLQFLIDACAEQVRKGCPYFYENMYGDQVYPFDIG